MLVIAVVYLIYFNFSRIWYSVIPCLFFFYVDTPFKVIVFHLLMLEVILILEKVYKRMNFNVKYCSTVEQRIILVWESGIVIDSNHYWTLYMPTTVLASYHTLSLSIHTAAIWDKHSELYFIWRLKLVDNFLKFTQFISRKFELINQISVTSPSFSVASIK